MRIFNRTKSLFQNLFRKGRRERELRRETESLLQLLVDEQTAQGKSEAEALRNARMELGLPEQFKESVREVSAGRLLEDFFQDLRFGARHLSKSWTFTSVAIVTLALGLGANAAVFSLLNSVLLKPLPYSEPDRLVRSTGRDSWLDIHDWVLMNQTFEGFGAYMPWTFPWVDEVGAHKLDGARVIGDLFKVMGVEPMLGRYLGSEDSVGAGTDSLLLSHSSWRAQFAEDPDIVGRRVTFEERSYTVVGVMPPDFQLPGYEAQVWTPQGENEGTAPHRDARTFIAVGRLSSGVSLELGQSDMNSIAERLEKLHPEENTDIRYEFVPLLDSLVGDIRPALLLLFGCVGFVLLIACVNVANLLLGRAAARQREMDLRSALGAGRIRLLRQRISENLLLAFLGGALGLAIAYWLIEVIVARTQAELPRVSAAGLDGSVLVFLAAVTAVCGCAFGLVPGARTKPQQSLAGLRKGSEPTPRGRRFLDALVVSEIALACLLVTGAGLMLVSFDRLLDVDPGFDTRDLVVLDIGATGEKYQDIEARSMFFDQTEMSIKSLPGVESVALTTDLPMDSDYIVSQTFLIEGRPELSPGTEPSAYYRSINSDYFRALGVPLLSGRTFDSRDRAGSAPVAIINQSMAGQFFEDEDPIGQRIRRARSGEPPMTIVGVVADIRPFALDSVEVPSVYYAHHQEYHSWKSWMLFAVRTSQGPTKLADAVRAELAGIDPAVPLGSVRTMDQMLSQSYAQRTLTTTLLGTFAAMALLLASLGIYGVISDSVRRRTHEIGVRAAMGANRTETLRLVLKHGLLLTSLGIGLGLLGGAVLARTLEAQLYGVSKTDPTTFAGAALLLMSVAMIASLVPALRATKVDPTTALRCE